MFVIFFGVPLRSTARAPRIDWHGKVFPDLGGLEQEFILPDFAPPKTGASFRLAEALNPRERDRIRAFLRVLISAALSGFAVILADVLGSAPGQSAADPENIKWDPAACLFTPATFDQYGPKRVFALIDL
jgi:hypothetical protein